MGGVTSWIVLSAVLTDLLTTGLDGHGLQRNRVPGDQGRSDRLEPYAGQLQDQDEKGSLSDQLSDDRGSRQRTTVDVDGRQGQFNVQPEQVGGA